MISQRSAEFEKLIEESNRLREAGRFTEAVNVLVGEFSGMEPECLKAACRHTIHVARQGGLNELALARANELAKIEPDDPLVVEILGKAHRSHKTHEGGLNELAKSSSAA